MLLTIKVLALLKPFLLAENYDAPLLANAYTSESENQCYFVNNIT